MTKIIIIYNNPINYTSTKKLNKKPNVSIIENICKHNIFLLWAPYQPINNENKPQIIDAIISQRA